MFCEGRRRLRNSVAGLTTLLLIAPAAAAPLITEQEARLPLDETQPRGGIERGPDIVPVYPTPKSGAIQSPFAFRVKFQSHGNTRIDLDSLVVVYKKLPAIDLTERIRPFAQSGGINMPDAEVPAGVHRILIFIKDSAGHERRADIRFEVR